MKINEMVRTLGISDVECAKYLDANPLQVKKWISGEQDAPYIVKSKMSGWMRFHAEGLDWRPKWVHHLGNFKDHNLFH